jgi:hypothetical protein
MIRDRISSKLLSSNLMSSCSGGSPARAEIINKMLQSRARKVLQRFILSLDDTTSSKVEIRTYNTTLQQRHTISQAFSECHTEVPHFQEDRLHQG